MTEKNWDRIDPIKIYDEMTEAAERYANSQRVADLCEAAAEYAFDTVFLSIGDGSVDKRKAQARSSVRHQEALKAYIDARKVALRDKLEWTALVTKLDFVRTLETSLRAQVQHISHTR